jgi:hypothetical protein
VCTQVCAPRLPLTLLARNLVDLQADKDRGGALALVQLAFGKVLDVEAHGIDVVANSHKLALVLVHPDEARARPGLNDFDVKPSFAERMAMNGFGPGLRLDISHAHVSRFRDVAELRGNPGRGGSRLQILSAVRWV